MVADVALECTQGCHVTRHCMEVKRRHNLEQTSVTATLLLTIDIKQVSLSSISSSSSSSAKGGLGGASDRSAGGGRGGGGGGPVEKLVRNV